MERTGVKCDETSPGKWHGCKDLNPDERSWRPPCLPLHHTRILVLASGVEPEKPRFTAGLPAVGERQHEIGANGVSRTPGPPVMSRTLWPLSYTGELVGAVGIEPTMAGSKAAALPLGYAPIDLSAECAHKTQTPCGSIAPLYGVKGPASDRRAFRFFGAARETRTPVRRVKANVSCIRRWRQLILNYPKRFRLRPLRRCETVPVRPQPGPLGERRCLRLS